MDDDLNTAGALGELFALAGELFRYVGAADAAGHAADTAVLEDVEDLIVECLDTLCISLPDDTLWSPAAEPVAAVRGADGGDGGDGEVCATDDVPLPPAARLPAEGRWDDLAGLVDERLSCGDATYACAAARPLPCREGLGRGRRPARRSRPPASRCATPAGGTQVVRRRRGELSAAIGLRRT